MEIIILILKAIGVALFLMLLLIFMVWPVNDDQKQAPGWVLCRFIKRIYEGITKVK